MAKRGPYYFKKNTPFIDRVYFEPNTGCWIWGAVENGRGYGVCKDPKTGASVYAHRMSYSIYKGEIPDGYEIDHLCRNVWCVNPDHLEAVTPE